MKKYLLLLSSVLAALSACSRTDTLPTPDPEPIRIVVDVDGALSTRATDVTAQNGRNDSADEAAVGSLQVFVFNGEALDGYGSSTGSKAATVSCTAGEREVWAVVNAGPLSSVTSRAGLLRQVASLGSGPSDFGMIGSTTATLRSEGRVGVTVSRHAARVVIRGIRNALGNAAQAADFKILSVYLTNVAGDVDFGHSSLYTVSAWYNKRGYQASNSLGPAAYDAVNASVEAGATYSTPHFFYSMPNGNEGKVGGAWSPRACRLVIRAQIAGVVYDYPILLPALEGNRSYEIGLVTITRAGNLDDGREPDDDRPDDDDEEKPVVGFEQGFEISVNDWTVVLVDGTGNITI